LFCSNRVCQCSDQNVWVDRMTQCLERKALHDECEAKEQCNGEHVTCRDFKCQCQFGSIYVPVLGKCVIPKNHSEVCSNDLECNSNNLLICAFGTCRCKTRYEFLNGKCEKVGCTADNECENNQVCNASGRCESREVLPGPQRPINPPPTNQDDEEPKEPQHPNNPQDTETRGPQEVALNSLQFCFIGVGCAAILMMMLMGFWMCRRKGKDNYKSSLQPPMQYKTYPNSMSIYPKISGSVQFA
jgi:hypothetical protein